MSLCLDMCPCDLNRGMCVCLIVACVFGMPSHDYRSHGLFLFQIVFVLSIFLFLSLSLYLFLTLSSLKPPAKLRERFLSYLLV